MKCPKCQYKNPMDTKFCGKCGVPLQSSQTETIQTPSIRYPRAGPRQHVLRPV
jgi:hypothetical protein